MSQDNNLIQLENVMLETRLDVVTENIKFVLPFLSSLELEKLETAMRKVNEAKTSIRNRRYKNG